MQTLETTGRKCTKCEESEPDVSFTGRQNAYGKLYYREMCNKCYNSIQVHRANAIANTYGARTFAAIKKHRPPEGTPCACCGVEMTHDKGIAGMCFDHDPQTETFRGYICKKCNTSIGGLGDTLDGLFNAVRYLQTANNAIN